MQLSCQGFSKQIFELILLVACMSQSEGLIILLQLQTWVLREFVTHPTVLTISISQSPSCGAH